MPGNGGKMDPSSKVKSSPPTLASSVTTPVSGSTPPVAAVLESSAAQQLELELCWCIQQLQGALTSTKMNPKQSADALRSLNVLKNNSAPLVKKRQIMRSTFGDYRTKMAEEEKKFKKAKPHMKLDSPSPDKNSRFFKRCAAKFSLVRSDNSFRFNFKDASMENKDAAVENKDAAKVENKDAADGNKDSSTTIPQTEVVLSEHTCMTIDDSENLKPKTATPFKYNMSDNSFRFNFNVEENDNSTNIGTGN